MNSILPVLGLGFFLGMRHATDPDHVVAVTTLVARHRSIRSAALIGAAWGVGHTLTIMAVGSGIILAGWVIPPRVGLSLEFSVGVMLIILGIINLRGMLGDVRQVARPEASGHVHAHAHGDYVHTHPHAHDPEAHPHPPEATPVHWLDRRFGSLRAYQWARPFLVGIVHGLAGSAAVALLVLTTIQVPSWAVVYLAIFGVGTVVGMMLITMAIAAPFLYADRRYRWISPGLRYASGVLSLVFGLFLAWQIGVVHGLFRASPE